MKKIILSLFTTLSIVAAPQETKQLALFDEKLIATFSNKQLEELKVETSEALKTAIEVHDDLARLSELGATNPHARIAFKDDLSKAKALYEIAINKQSPETQSYARSNLGALILEYQDSDRGTSDSLPWLEEAFEDDTNPNAQVHATLNLAYYHRYCSNGSMRKIDELLQFSTEKEMAIDAQCLLHNMLAGRLAQSNLTKDRKKAIYHYSQVAKNCTDGTISLLARLNTVKLRHFITTDEDIDGPKSL